MKVGIVAGEASGDILGGGLVDALRTLQPHLSAEGIGGPVMSQAGCHNLYESERLAVMGFVEPLFHLPELIRIRNSIKKHFIQHRPDVFVGIDAPDFNLGLELALRKTGIPVVHYVSPSVWAWRKQRIHKIKKAADLMLTLFPFEKKFYDEHDMPAVFVGHPLANKIPLSVDKAAARKELGLDEQANYIALLPGSRRSEIHHMGETFIKAAKECWQANPALRFITSSINQERDQELKQLMQRIVPDLPLQFFQQQSHAVMAAADVVLVASGTATLETMLYKRPMVIVYQTGFLTYQLAKLLVDLQFIGLPNLLANERLVPEYIQEAAQPVVLANALLDWLNYPEKQQALQHKFTEIHEQLRQNANQEAARAVLSILK